MWMQGEHVALIGKTGTGKTTLLEALGNRRKFVLMLLTKSDSLAWRKFKTINHASQMDTARAAADGSVRLLLRCAPAEREKQFRQAIKKAYSQGGWTIGFDELYELQLLGLESEVIQLYSEGRSERVTCIGGMQRPSFITSKGMIRWAISQPRHVFQFHVEERDRKTTAEIYGKSWLAFTDGLRQFEYAYMDQITGNRATGSVQKLSEVFK